MKFLLLLNKDIYCANCIKLLSPEMEKHEVKIILSQKVGDISDLPLELVEMKGFEEDLDKNDGVFDKYPTVFSEDLEIPQNVNSDEILQKIKKFTPDLIISIRFGQIL